MVFFFCPCALFKKFVEVQPNDGFGVLLPLESLILDVIFHAKKAKEYSFELTCKTEINRCVRPLKAIGFSATRLILPGVCVSVCVW